MLKCGNCKYNDDCTKVIRIEMENCTEYRPLTNADRIRAMTDEELAKWFGKIQYDTAYDCAGECKQKYPYPDGWLDWLKQEAMQ